MGNLIKLVKTYRVTVEVSERLSIAEQIVPLIQNDLRFFVFASIRPPAAEDVAQEILKGIFKSLPSFKGNSAGEFWSWCYRIARNKMVNQYTNQASDKLQPMPPEELWQLVDSSAQARNFSSADRHDLQYAMDLLASSKPECRDYLWNHFVFGLDYGEIATEENATYDNVRMKIGRCLQKAQSLVS